MSHCSIFIELKLVSLPTSSYETSFQLKNVSKLEFPLWHNGIGNAETQVRSPTLHNEFRIQHWHSCSLDCNCSSDLIPGLGIPYTMGQAKKKKGRKKFLVNLLKSLKLLLNECEVEQSSQILNCKTLYLNMYLLLFSMLMKSWAICLAESCRSFF